MEKITFASADSQENEEFFVLEQTKLNGVSYILVTDSEEDDAECWILKDTSPEESSEAIYEFVEDEKELNGIMGVFEELLEDVLDHLTAEVGVDLETGLGRQLVDVGVEQVVLEVDLLEQHTGVEQVGLIHVDVVGIVAVERRGVDKVLNGRHIVVHKQLFALNIARKAAHAVVHRDNVRIERADEVVEGGQRRDLAAGGHVDVHAEGRKAGIRMVLGVGVHGDMALVEVRHDGIRLERRLHVLLRDQEGDGSALRIVVLLGDVQHMCADHLGQLFHDAGQSLGVVLLIDVLDVVALFSLGLCVADIVNIKGQRLGQVVKAVEFELVLHIISSQK